MVTLGRTPAEKGDMFTEKTIGRDDVREPALSPLDADFAAHAAAIEELYRTILIEIGDAARAWTPEAARFEGHSRRTDAIPAPRTETRAQTRAESRREARTEAITVQQPEARTEAITVQQPDAPIRTRGAHHAETGQMAAITMRPAVPRNVAA
jgi:hypothetical protein